MISSRYYSLDGMRGIAAIAVLGLHIGVHLNLGWLPHAYVAVDFFFMLSGFVLTRAYAEKLSSSMPAWQFAKIRIVRLYPLFALGAALGILVGIVRIVFHTAHSISPSQLAVASALSFAMLPDPQSQDMFPLNSPSWSLFYEMLANILMAVFLLKLKRGHLVIVCVLSATVFFWAAVRMGDFALMGSRWDLAPFAFVRTTYSFSLGIIAARWTHADQRISSIHSLALIALFIFCLVAAPPILSAAILLPVILVFGVWFELPAFATGIAAALGELSFPLYAIHLPLLEIATFTGRRLHIGDRSIGVTVLCVAPIVALWLAKTFDLGAREMLKRALTRSVVKQSPL